MGNRLKDKILKYYSPWLSIKEKGSSVLSFGSWYHNVARPLQMRAVNYCKNSGEILAAMKKNQETEKEVAGGRHSFRSNNRAQGNRLLH
jgi:hypothetical protein